MRALLDPGAHWRATREIIALLTHHRQLTWEMAKRELQDRYAGQVMGLMWAVIHPVAIILVYLFLFIIVFKVRFPPMEGVTMDYASYILAGLIPWFYFQESMIKGCTAISSNAPLVKQVVFPIEVLPVKGVLVSLLSQAVATAILLCYMLLRHGGVPWTIVFFPAALLLEGLLMTGLSYILSAVGAYIRDVKDIVQVLLLMSMYLTPTFYLPAMVPATFKYVIYLNPFSYMIWVFQDIFFFGWFQHPWAWVIFTGEALLVFYGGYRVFRKAKMFFGNVL
ncbi:MAG: ABC transporter permease [Candidatus Nitrospinota bacterium M3_3B_026]